MLQTWDCDGGKIISIFGYLWLPQAWTMLKSLERWLSPLLGSITHAGLVWAGIVEKQLILDLNRILNSNFNLSLPRQIGKSVAKLVVYVHIFTTSPGLRCWILGKTDWLIEKIVKFCVLILTGINDATGQTGNQAGNYFAAGGKWSLQMKSLLRPVKGGL